jgi:hypothetical protein
VPDAVGLDADLVLAIDRALSDVDRLEAALAAATTGIPVSLDVSGVDQQLADAITAGSATPVVVAADTAEIPTSIEDAVAAITPDVVVGADTGDAETSIAGLADAPPVDVPVSADTTDAETTIAGLADQPPVDVPVDADTDPATAAIASLSTSVPPIVVEVDADLTAATEQVSNLGAASSSSESAVSGLEGSVTGLGVAAGITEGSAKELLSTLGEMGGEGSGAVAAAGAVGTLAVVTGGFFTEGMQAVSAGQRFNMLLGDMAEKIDHIDLNGLNTSVKDLGLSFGSTESEMENVNARLYQNAINAGVSKDKAVEFAQQIDTLAARAIALNPQLGTLDEAANSLGDKLARGGRFAQLYGIQLTASEIATRALADTGKETAADLTVVEKSIAGAELASEKYGATLAGTVAEGQKNAAVQARELKARFQEAIEEIGVPLVSPVLDLIREAEPDAVLIAEALGRLAKDALPAVAAALDVIGPPLRLVSGVLDQIPDPVITGTVAFLGLNAALEALAVRIAGVEAETAVFAPEIAALAGVAAAVVAVTSAFGDTAPYADEVTRAIDTQSKGFDDLTVSVRETVLAEVDGAAESTRFAQALNDAHVTADQLTDGLISGGDEWDRYVKQVIDAAGGFSVWNVEGDKVLSQLDHLRDATNDSAESTLNKAVADKQLTQADMDAAVANAGLVDGHVNYAKALDILHPKLAQAEADTQKKADADKAATQAEADHAASLTNIADNYTAVSWSLIAVQDATGDTTGELEGLAVALNAANLEGKDFDAVAQELGVTTEQLKQFVSDVTGQIDDFVNTAMKGLPDVSAAIDDVLNPKKEPPKSIVIDPDALQAEIDADIEKINAFNLQLAFLTEHGLDNLAQVAAAKGPEFTNALVSKIQDGGDEMGRTLDEKFGELNTLTRNEPDKLRDAGQGIVLATGQIAADATAEFGDKFNLRDPTDDEVRAAKRIAEEERIPYADALRMVAGDGVAAYGTELDRLPGATSDAMSNAHTEISGWGGSFASVGEGTGGQATGGFQKGVDGFSGAVTSALQSATGVITDPNNLEGLISGAYTSAKLVGAAFDDGLSVGIDKNVAVVTASAAAAVNAAEQAARDAAQSHSPSQVFADIGLDIASGLAQGIDAGSSVAEIAAADLATKTAASAEDAAQHAFAQATIETQDNLYQLGLTSVDEYVAQLRARLGLFVPLSNEWTSIVSKIEGIATDAAQRQAEAAKDQAAAEKAAADAAEKAVEAAARVAQEHQKIHDVEFQVGDLDASAYLDMLNHRMQVEEEAGRKYGDAWKQAYDIAQRVKKDMETASLVDPFVDLADQLDVDVSKVHDFVDKMNEAIDRVVSDAKASLPSIGSILQQSLDEAGLLDTTKLESNLDDQITQIEQFSANVDQLMAAGLTRTAELAIQQGPAAAAALAAAGSASLEDSLAKFDDAQSKVADKAKNEWGPALVDGLGETAEIAGQVFGDKFTDNFLKELQGNAATIEDALNAILSGAAPADIDTDYRTGHIAPKVVPISLPAAAPGVSWGALARDHGYYTGPDGRPLLHIDHIAIDAGGQPITDANARTLGDAMGARLADALSGRLAGIVKK